MNTIQEDHFKNLVAVAYADGILDGAEEELLKLKALEYGLAQTTVDFIIEDADKLQFIVPRTIIDREKQISEAVTMATIDGELHQKEYNLLLSLALRLGFTESALKKEIDKQCIEREIVIHKD